MFPLIIRIVHYRKAGTYKMAPRSTNEPQRKKRRRRVARTEGTF